MIASRIAAASLLASLALLPEVVLGSVRPLPIQIEVRANDGTLVPAHVRILYWKHPRYLWYQGDTGTDGTLEPGRKCAQSAGLYLEAVPVASGYAKGARTCYDPQPLVIPVDTR